MVLHYRKSHLRQAYTDDRAGSPRQTTGPQGRATNTGSPRLTDQVAVATRPQMSVRGASLGTRSGWGDLTSDPKEAADGHVNKEDYEKICRTNRILKAHHLALERETKEVENRLIQLRFSRQLDVPEDELFLAERPSTAPAEQSPKPSRRSISSPRKIDDTGRLCFIPKNTRVSAAELYKMLPKRFVTRPPRKAWRGPGLASASGWGALDLTGSLVATDTEVAQITKENMKLEEVIDSLERKKMLLKQEVREEKEIIMPKLSAVDSAEDWSDRLDDVLRGPSPKTRSGWGGIEQVHPWCLGSPRSAMN